MTVETRRGHPPCPGVQLSRGRRGGPRAHRRLRAVVRPARRARSPTSMTSISADARLCVAEVLAACARGSLARRPPNSIVSSARSASRWWPRTSSTRPRPPRRQPTTIGGPVVCKLESGRIHHKSDVGGVVLDLEPGRGRRHLPRHGRAVRRRHGRGIGAADDRPRRRGDRRGRQRSLVRAGGGVRARRHRHRAAGRPGPAPGPADRCRCRIAARRAPQRPAAEGLPGRCAGRPRRTPGSAAADQPAHRRHR